MNRTPSFASTRRRLAGSAAHSVFSQSNLRSAAHSSVASSTSAPPAPSEADLFDPVSPAAAPNTPTANAQPPQTPSDLPKTGTNTPSADPNTAPTGANGTILPSNTPQTPPNTTPDAPKTPISSTLTPPAGTKPSATNPNAPQTPSAHPQTPPNSAQTGANGTILPPNTPTTGTKPTATSTNTPQTPSAPSPTQENTPPAGANGTILPPNTAPTSPNTPPTTSTPGSACSVRPHTDAPCGPSAKLAVVPFATWPTVASHSDTPEAERPHWRARLLEHYSPERQVSFGEHPEWCYSSPRPTLRRLRDQLGSETVVTWLCLQLNYAAQLWGTADGLTSHQLRGAAEAIGASYAELNVGEVMVYLCRLRGGRYGKVAYGSLSADAMVSNLPLYMKERREELSQHERRAADRALAEELDARAARCCTHAQYEVLHARARVLAGGDEAEAFRLLQERFWETDTGAASPAEAAR